MRNLFTLAIALLGASYVPQAMATPVSGTFNLAGLDNASVQPTSLDFLCSTNGVATLIAPCASSPAGAGNFNTTSGTGDFTAYDGQGGYILDLDQTVTPLNTSFDLLNFITFSTSGPPNPVATPDIALDLTFIFLGSSGQADCGSAAAAGQVCTPVIPALANPNNPDGLSPYNLQNLAGGGSSASFAVAGNIRRISTGELTPFLGTFTSQFNVSYQQVLSDLNDFGHVDNSYSATFAGSATTIPEPGTLPLLVGGVLLLAAGSFRKFRRT